MSKKKSPNKAVGRMLDKATHTEGWKAPKGWKP